MQLVRTEFHLLGKENILNTRKLYIYTCWFSTRFELLGLNFFYRDIKFHCWMSYYLNLSEAIYLRLNH